MEKELKRGLFGLNCQPIYDLPKREQCIGLILYEREEHKHAIEVLRILRRNSTILQRKLELNENEHFKGEDRVFYKPTIVRAVKSS